MELLYKSRVKIETDFIQEICDWSLNQNISQKIDNPENNWAFCFVEGRPDIEINKYEHLACFHASTAFSKYRIPILCFVNNVNNFLNNDQDLIKKYNIQIIKIGPLTSNSDYSRFCIESLYHLIPKQYEHIITISADSWLLKPGVEDYCLKGGWGFIRSPYKHFPAIEYFEYNEWKPFFYPVYGFNGGASYRKASFCRNVSICFKDFILRENFTDCKYPNEDLLYSVVLNGTNINFPTHQEGLRFAQDPMTKKLWNNKENWSFMFHFIKTISEFDK